MSASSHTTNYNLPIYAPDDVPQYLGENDSWNSTMQTLDAAIKDAKESGGGGTISYDQSTGQSSTSAMSQKATTDAINGLNTTLNNSITQVENKIPAVLTETGTSETATMSQKAITDAINAGGGGSEISGRTYSQISSAYIFTNTPTKIGETITLQPGKYLITHNYTYTITHQGSNDSQNSVAVNVTGFKNTDYVNQLSISSSIPHFATVGGSTSITVSRTAYVELTETNNLIIKAYRFSGTGSPDTIALAQDNLTVIKFS